MRTFLIVSLVATACALSPPRRAAAQSAAARSDPPPAMAAYQRLARETISGERAKDVVAFMDHWFRLPGNHGFDASLERVVAALEEAGYVEEGSTDAGTAGGALTYRLEHRPLERPTWEPVSATLTLGGADDAAALLGHEPEPGGHQLLFDADRRASRPRWWTWARATRRASRARTWRGRSSSARRPSGGSSRRPCRSGAPWVSWRTGSRRSITRKSTRTSSPSPRSPRTRWRARGDCCSRTRRESHCATPCARVRCGHAFASRLASIHRRS